MKAKKYTLALALGTFLLALDQITKTLAMARLRNQPPFVLISGVLEFRYYENRAAAFGNFGGMPTLLLVVNCLLAAALLWLFWRMPATRDYRIYRLLTTILIAGALGNILDRIVHGFVIDFIYIILINFPIFNVADMCITGSVITFAIYWLACKDDRLERLFSKAKKPDATEKTTETPPADGPG